MSLASGGAGLVWACSQCVIFISDRQEIMSIDRIRSLLPIGQTRRPRVWDDTLDVAALAASAHVRRWHQAQQLGIEMLP